MQDGQEIEAKEIVVNDPLVHQGLRFYQASFGNTGKLTGLKVAVTPDSAGHQRRQILQCQLRLTSREMTLPFNEPVATGCQHDRYPGRIHSRLFRSRQPGLQTLG